MLSLQYLSSINHPIIPYNRKKPFGFSVISCRSTKFNCPNNYSSLSYFTDPTLILMKNRGLAVNSSGAVGGIINDDQQKNDYELPEGLESELIPKHVAFMSDGARRWANNRGLHVDIGNKAGTEATKNLAINCSKLGVKVLTVFAFSNENWARPQKDVSSFMTSVGEMTAKTYLEEDILRRYDIKFSLIGNKARLPKLLQTGFFLAEEYSKANKGMHLRLALSYSGRYDITEATKRIASKVKDGILEVKDIDQNLFEQHLKTSDIEYRYPDLLIRTSGEFRLSNFMMWHLAHTQLMFVQKLLPDFQESDLVEAFKLFQHRKKNI